MGRVAHSFCLSQTEFPPNVGNTPDMSLPWDFPLEHSLTLYEHRSDFFLVLRIFFFFFLNEITPIT